MTTDTLVTVAQYAVVAALAVLGQYVVAKLSSRAQGEQTEVDSQARATEAWQSYAQEMKERLDTLEGRFQAAEVEREQDRRRIRALERQSEDDRALIRRLVARLRAALAEIRRLGGSVTDTDTQLTETATDRLQF